MSRIFPMLPTLNRWFSGGAGVRVRADGTDSPGEVRDRSLPDSWEP